MRDIEADAEKYRAVFGELRSPASRTAFATRPKPPLLAGRTIAFLSDSLLLAATTRNRVDQSHFDLFGPDSYLGELVIPDRLIEFDAGNEMVVVIAEGDTVGPLGIYPRFFRWYRLVPGPPSS